MYDTTPTKHLRPGELASRWGVSIGHLANLRHRGEGCAYLKLGGAVVYRLADVEAFEAARIVRPVVAAGAAA